MNRRMSTLLAVTGLILVTGCVRVPTDGPVEETRSDSEVNTDPGVFIDPRPPQKGENRADIVDHFLDAMQATPIQTRTAKEFLTEDAAAAWKPELETITYAEPPAPRDGPGGVTVTLTGADTLDAKGAWNGALPPERRDITFPMAMEDGEWRIDAAPDALIVPEDWFGDRYRQVNLYFFDPTASILAPEPVFVPKGEQLASTLTKALVAGPGEDLRQVVQSFVPSGLQVLVGVRVDDGVAQIALEGDAQLTAETTELMMAQFAWTLRQDLSIESIQVSIGGEPVPLPGGVSEYRVDGGGEYDPAGFQSSPVMHGLRNDRVVAGTATALAPVDGPLGSRDYGLESIGVSIDATTLAGVTAGGTALLVGDLDGTGPRRVRTAVDDGTELLRPAWDFSDRIWLVDRTTDGARVSYLRGTRFESLRVPGLTGQNVRSFLISRDGTRLVAVVRRDDRDRLVVSRIQHSATGRVIGATPAERIGSGGGDPDLPIRAIAWTSPDRLAELVPVTPTQVVQVSVDGSPAGRVTTTVPTTDGRMRSLAGSPDTDEPLYGLARGEVVDIPNQQVGDVDKHITTLVYVG